MRVEKRLSRADHEEDEERSIADRAEYGGMRRVSSYGCKPDRVSWREKKDVGGRKTESGR